LAAETFFQMAQLKIVDIDWEWLNVAGGARILLGSGPRKAEIVMIVHFVLRTGATFLAVMWPARVAADAPKTGRTTTDSA
jgi:hypothetical protein